MVYSEVRHVLVPRVRQQSDHLLPVPRGRLEEIIRTIEAIDDPGMLPINLWLRACDDTTDVEFCVDSYLG